MALLVAEEAKSAHLSRDLLKVAAVLFASAIVN